MPPLLLLLPLLLPPPLLPPLLLPLPLLPPLLLPLPLLPLLFPLLPPLLPPRRRRGASLTAHHWLRPHVIGGIKLAQEQTSDD
jgi:hypothetical protein